MDKYMNFTLKPQPLMTITKTLECYATGTLCELPYRELVTMHDAVIEKIGQMETVLRCHDLSPELTGDCRRYRAVRQAIALELEKKTRPSNEPGRVSNNNLMCKATND